MKKPLVKLFGCSFQNNITQPLRVDHLEMVYMNLILKDIPFIILDIRVRVIIRYSIYLKQI